MESRESTPRMPRIKDAGISAHESSRTFSASVPEAKISITDDRDEKKREREWAEGREGGNNRRNILANIVDRASHIR